MSKTRRKITKPIAKAAKRPTPNRGKRRFITRAEARRRAERHVFNRMFKGATVRDGAEVRLCLDYNPGPAFNWSSKDTWVVYKNVDQPWALKSSSVVLVCKRTGRVVYEGSAGDEG